MTAVMCFFQNRKNLSSRARLSWTSLWLCAFLAPVAWLTPGTALSCGNPCFAENDDILSGQRTLLASDDLQLTAQPLSNVPTPLKRYYLQTEDLAISNITSSSNVVCTSYPQIRAQSLIGRMFALPNDVLVNLRGIADCSIGLKLHVFDKLNSNNDFAFDINLGTGDTTRPIYVGMAMADFNKDGYQDIIYVSDFLAQVYTAKCTGDPGDNCTEAPSAGFV